MEEIINVKTETAEANDMLPRLRLALGIGAVSIHFGSCLCRCAKKISTSADKAGITDQLFKAYGFAYA